MIQSTWTCVADDADAGESVLGPTAGQVEAVITKLQEVAVHPGPDPCFLQLYDLKGILDECTDDYQKLQDQQDIIRQKSVTEKPLESMIRVRDQLRRHLFNNLKGALDKLKGIPGGINNASSGTEADGPARPTQMVPWDWTIQLKKRYKQVADELMGAAPRCWLEEPASNSTDEAPRITEGPSALVSEWEDLQAMIVECLEPATSLCAAWLENGQDDATLYAAGLAGKEASATLGSLQAAMRKASLIFHRMGLWLEAIAADWEWANDQIQLQKEALQVLQRKFPPDSTGLQARQQRLLKIEEELDMVNVQIKHRRKQGMDATESEEKLKALREQLRREKLDVAIGKERSRLYRIAQQHFPELLHKGSEWSKSLGLDSSQMAFMACRSGLMAEGRRLEDFEVYSEDAVGTQHFVYHARDIKGCEWALKEFPLAKEGAMRRFYRQ